MVSSKELKRRAWASVEQRYWSVFLAALVGGELASVHAMFSSSTNLSDLTKMAEEGAIDAEVAIMLGSLFGGLTLLITVLSFLAYAFVSGPATVGLCKYFIINTERKPSFTEIFSGFRTNYMGNAKIMFAVYIKSTLWTLLFIVPGIIKSYEYAMIPYILADNPGISTNAAFALSKRMMTGNKWNLFKLEISFIGWYLLGFLMCCIGIMFIMPYERAARAEFYLEVRDVI